MSLFGRMLVELGFLDREDERRRLRRNRRHCRRDFTGVHIWLKVVALRYCSAREMLEQREDKRALKAMTLPVYWTATSVILEKHVRSEERRVGKACVSTCRTRGAQYP